MHYVSSGLFECYGKIIYFEVQYYLEENSFFFLIKETKLKSKKKQ